MATANDLFEVVKSGAVKIEREPDLPAEGRRRGASRAGEPQDHRQHRLPPVVAARPPPGATRMDRLQQLSVFRRVVETGNITRAARDLAMSQPSVSRIIGELEQRLGVPLLLRSPRGLTATEAGQAFHAEAVQHPRQAGGGREPTPAAPRRRCVAPPDRLRRRLLQCRGAALAARLPAGPIRGCGSRSGWTRADRPGRGGDRPRHPLRPDPPAVADRAQARPDRFRALRLARLPGAGPARRPCPRSLAQHEFCRLTSGPVPRAALPLDGPGGRTVPVETHGRLQRRQRRHHPSRRAGRAGHRAAGALGGDGGGRRRQRLVPVLPGWRAEPRDVHAVWPGGHILPRRVRAVLDLLVAQAALEPRLKAR